MKSAGLCDGNDTGVESVIIRREQRRSQNERLRGEQRMAIVGEKSAKEDRVVKVGDRER